MSCAHPAPGYERGAFTDARERKLGLAEAADQGTLFLDEIGDRCSHEKIAAAAPVRHADVAV